MISRLIRWWNRKAAERMAVIANMKMTVLLTIGSNGVYLLPPGFIDEPYDTTLRVALRELRAGNFIVLDGHEKGFERWVVLP